MESKEKGVYVVQLPLTCSEASGTALSRDEVERMKQMAESRGQSVRVFVSRAIKGELKRKK